MWLVTRREPNRVLPVQRLDLPGRRSAATRHQLPLHQVPETHRSLHGGHRRPHHGVGLYFAKANQRAPAVAGDHRNVRHIAKARTCAESARMRSAAHLSDRVTVGAPALALVLGVATLQSSGQAGGFLREHPRALLEGWAPGLGAGLQVGRRSSVIHARKRSARFLSGFGMAARQPFSPVVYRAAVGTTSRSRVSPTVRSETVFSPEIAVLSRSSHSIATLSCFALANRLRFPPGSCCHRSRSRGQDDVDSPSPWTKRKWQHGLEKF